MLVIDGSFGEGGGQIVRTSLAMSIITGTPVRIENIRKGRDKPGLKKQHLTSVRAAERIGNATVDGAELGSKQISFTPRAIVPGDYTFSIGTAGSVSLVLQTVLPPLLVADRPSVLRLEGGTHNSMSPPFDFLHKTFAPLLERMGAKLELTLERPGFFPAGGGRITARITPPSAWKQLELNERGAIRSKRARAVVSKLPRKIAERELAVVKSQLGFTDLRVEEIEDAAGPGNVLMLEVESEHVTEVVTGFGERGTRAEEVASRAGDEMARYLAYGAPVGEHLADQLLIPMALAGGGAYTTQPLTLHTTTNLDILGRFIPIKSNTRADTQGRVTVQLER